MSDESTRKPPGNKPKLPASSKKLVTEALTTDHLLKAMTTHHLDQTLGGVQPVSKPSDSVAPVGRKPAGTSGGGTAGHKSDNPKAGDPKKR